MKPSECVCAAPLRYQSCSSTRHFCLQAACVCTSKQHFQQNMRMHKSQVRYAGMYVRRLGYPMLLSPPSCTRVLRLFVFHRCLATASSRHDDLRVLHDDDGPARERETFLKVCHLPSFRQSLLVRVAFLSYTIQNYSETSDRIAAFFDGYVRFAPPEYAMPGDFQRILRLTEWICTSDVPATSAAAERGNAVVHGPSAIPLR